MSRPTPCCTSPAPRKGRAWPNCALPSQHLRSRPRSGNRAAETPYPCERLVMTEDENANRANVLSEALPYMRRYADKTIVVKYGGHAMGDTNVAASFAR